MQMRRRDREVRDDARIDGIIRACRCCRLGFVDGDRCYIVPLSFGFTHEGERVFYFHSAREGRKAALARAAGRASFELDCGYRLHEDASPCGYSCAFQSVMGEGRISEVTEPEAKLQALRHILDHTAGEGRSWTFPSGAADTVTVLRLTAETLSCKVHD